MTAESKAWLIDSALRSSVNGATWALPGPHPSCQRSATAVSMGNIRSVMNTGPFLAAFLARDVEAYGLDGVGKLLKRPLKGEQTLLGLIKSGQPLADAISELAAVLEVEERQRLRSKGGKVSSSAAEAAKDQSMPGYMSGA